MLSLRSRMFIISIIIFIPITQQQPEQDWLAENLPTGGLSNLNEYENGMRKSETELKFPEIPPKFGLMLKFKCLKTKI